VKERKFKGGIYGMGDIHGAFHEVDKIGQVVRALPEDSLLIQVGDFGIGFGDFRAIKEMRMLDSLNKLCSEKNVQIWAIRGNHDNPVYWKDAQTRSEFLHSFLMLSFIPDYTRVTINGINFLFVGGAISVDRTDRKEGINYWEDEIFVYDEKEIVLSQDTEILITHSLPSDVPPPTTMKGGIVERFAQVDKTLVEDLETERENLRQLVGQLPKLKRVYAGHFHQSQIFNKNGVKYYTLDIGEAREINFRSH
jgi:DNA repair exonuclease SbcCD nuclease subunit